MLPKPIEYRFAIEGEHYLLVEWTRGGEKRLRAEYAMAIAAAPAVIESIDGANLYAEAVARECLKEAPALFWEERPANAVANGTPRMVVTLEQVPRTLWDAFRKEVDAFLAILFPTVPAESPGVSAERPDDTVAVAIPEAVPTRLRGRAQ